MFSSIVAAVDLGPDGDRALPVTRALAAAGDLPVELLTVSSPHMDEATDTFELSRRAPRRTDGHRTPSPSPTTTTLHAAIVTHLEHRDDPLLVMATSAKASLAARFLGSVTEAVLGRIGQPVVLVGPNVPGDVELVSPTLVVFIDTDDLAEATVPAIVPWVRAFGGPPLSSWS